MQEHRKKVLSITLEVIALVVLTIGTYLGIMKLLIAPILIFGQSTFSIEFLIGVLIFDVIWILTIKFWPMKNIHIKIFLTLLLFAFSAAVITCHIGLYLLRDFTF
jgi:hypothetical protein